MTGVIHPTHSVVVIPHVRVSECSKCWACLCCESNKLTRPCTKDEGLE